MNNQNIKPFVNELLNAGRLAKGWLVAPKQQNHENRPVVFANLIVNLKEVMDSAAQYRASTVEIYADTVIMPRDYKAEVTGSIKRVSIIARRLEVSDTGSIVLDHRGQDNIRAVRLMVGQVAAGFTIYSQDKSNQEYDVKHSNIKDVDPIFTNYGFKNGALRVGDTKIPSGFLTRGMPLHLTLSATFALAAGSIGHQDGSPQRLTLAHALLRWITRWSGLGTDLAQIVQRSEALQGLLSLYQDNELTPAIPVLPARSYLELAKSRLDLAAKIELDRNFSTQSGTVADIANRFAQANIDRDQADAVYLEQQQQELEARIANIDAAIRRAVRSLDSQGFEKSFAAIHLELETKIDRIDRIVKAVFELVAAVISLVTSIASIMIGVPPDAQGGSTKAINGVQGLASALRQAGGGGGLGLVVRDLYLLPFKFAWDHKSDFTDAIKTLAASAVTIKNASSTLLNNNAAIDRVDQLVENVGSAVRELANKPSALEAIAAWDVMTTEVTNRLDVQINDSNTAGAVKQASANFKTTIQKMAIYGRLLAEHQANKDAAVRELGSLVLRRCANQKKAAAYNDMKASLNSREELNSMIQAQSALRLDEVRRSFFVACYGFRRAVFYETYRYPLAVPVMPRDNREMSSIYATMTTDLNTAQSKVLNNLSDFSKTLVFDDAEFIRDLTNDGLARLPIPTDQIELADYSHVRLHTIEAWLQSSKPEKNDVILELQSNSEFCDRKERKSLKFKSSEPIRARFEYRGNKIELQKKFDGVQPTPFSDWLISVQQADNLASTNALCLKLSGKVMT